MSEIIEENLNNLAYGTLLLLIGFFLGKLFSYIFRVIAARSGVDNYGLFALGVTFLGVLTLACLLGFDKGLTKFVSHYNAKKDNVMIKSYINTGLKITTLWSLILSVLLYLLSDFISQIIFHKPELGIVLKIFAILLPFYILDQMLIAIMTAYQKIKYVTLINIIQYGLALILLITLMFSNINDLAAPLAYASAFIIASIIAMFLVNKNIFNFFDKSIKTNKVVNELRNYSLPLMFNSFIEFFIISIDMLLIGYFLTSKDAGIYSAAYVTTHLISLVPAVLMWVFAPILSHLLAKNLNTEARHIFVQASRWIYLIIVPITIFAIIFSSQIMLVMFGSEYIAGNLSFLILAISVFILSVSSIERKSLEISNNTMNLLYFSVTSLVINLILNLILIPKYGINGSAISNLITFSVYTLLCVYLSWKKLGFVQNYTKYIAPLTASLISIIIANALFIYLKLNTSFIFIAILSLIYLVIYLIILKFLKFLTKEDIDMASSVFKRLLNSSKSKLKIKK